MGRRAPRRQSHYQVRALDEGDQFVLATDGVYEHVDPQFVLQALRDHAEDLGVAAQAIVAEAFARGSADNLTVQIVRVERLPDEAGGEIRHQLTELPLPPLLEPRAVFDGYSVPRANFMAAAAATSISAARGLETGRQVVLKIPSIDLRGVPAYLERFMMEQWVAQRIDSAHVLKPHLATRKRQFLYVVTEYIDGQTLTQWMVDNPRPDLETVRGIVEQLARGLLAFHRLEMLHRDLRPDNIMIDRAGTVKIIDFGSTLVAACRSRRWRRRVHVGTAVHRAGNTSNT